MTERADESLIGQWIYRTFGVRPPYYKMSRGHLVQSTIGDRYIVRCGKQIKAKVKDTKPNHLRAVASKHLLIDEGAGVCEACS